MAGVQDPICHKCSPPNGAAVSMDLAFEAKVQGLDTYRFVCPTCGGVTNLQTMKAPNGETLVRQVALNGNAEEYRPEDAHVLDGARKVMGKDGKAGWVVQDAAKHNRRFDLTEEVTPAFSIFSPKRAREIMERHGLRQQQAAAQATPQQAAQQQAAQQQYLASMIQAQQHAQAMARAGYQPVPGVNGMPARAYMPPLAQQVAYTLGQHPHAIMPPDPNALRRRVLGLPRQR